MKLNYWDNIKFKSTYVPNGAYVLFDWYPGGFNNIRMSLEQACVIAYALNRILIIPKPKAMYLLGKDKLSISNFFNVQDFNIVCEENYENFLKEYRNEIHTIDYISHQTLYKLNNDPVPNYFKGSNVVNLHTLENHKVLHFPRNLFGNFYHSIHLENNTHLISYVKKHIHYQQKFFTHAKNVVEKLGDLNYYAIHIRRGDFLVGGETSWMHNRIVFPAETILNNIQELVPPGSKLYIATDETNKEYFAPFIRKYEVYFYETIKQENIPQHEIGIVEQIVCSRAKSFVGTFVSTFSSYINRLRGYMEDVKDKRVINFCTKFDPSTPDLEKFDGFYSREYSLGWK